MNLAPSLALIPARKGSQRLPGKNIRDLAGKPLVVHSIEAALESKVFSDIVVSSDDERVLELAEAWGVKADSRPLELAGDKVESFSVIGEFLERPENKNRYQTVAKLLPTCPLRLASDIVGAWQLFEKGRGAVPVVGITEFDFPIQFALELQGEGPEVIMREPEAYQRKVFTSQSLKKTFRPNGAIYLASADFVQREKTFFSPAMVGYVMPPERSVDIDHLRDFLLAEALLTRRAPAK